MLHICTMYSYKYSLNYDTWRRSLCYSLDYVFFCSFLWYPPCSISISWIHFVLGPNYHSVHLWKPVPLLLFQWSVTLWMRGLTNDNAHENRIFRAVELEFAEQIQFNRVLLICIQVHSQKTSKRLVTKFMLFCSSIFVARQVNVSWCMSAVTFTTNSLFDCWPPNASDSDLYVEIPSVTWKRLFRHQVISAGGLLLLDVQNSLACVPSCSSFGSTVMLALSGATEMTNQHFWLEHRFLDLTIQRSMQRTGPGISKLWRTCDIAKLVERWRHFWDFISGEKHKAGLLKIYIIEVSPPSPLEMVEANF